MNMFYNHSTISVEELVKDGFIVEIHKDEFGSLKYGDSQAIVEYNLVDGRYYLGDICEFRGIEPLKVIQQLYQLFHIQLLDEDDREEVIEKQNKLYNGLFERTFKKRFEVVENELPFSDDDVVIKVPTEEEVKTDYAEFFVKNNS